MQYQELNLLVIFDAIMTESSITKAAKRLNITQSAVSNAVARMRNQWKDDLFVKKGRNIQPTFKAKDLWENIREPLHKITTALAPDEFNPEASERIFRVAIPDSVAGLVWPQLRGVLEREAPKVSVHAIPYTIVNGERVLNNAEVDLLVTVSNLMPPFITSKPLYEVEYVCVMNPAHKLASGKFTLQKFVNADHLLVSLSGDVFGYTDRVLAEKNLKRNIAMTVNGFSNVPSIIQQTNLISVLPSLFVENELKQGNLIARRLPIKIPNNQVHMYWHVRSEQDHGVCWLGEKIRKLFKHRSSIHQQILSKIQLK